MANSEFEYVRKHELWDAIPPDNWIVVRIDGRGFSKFSKRYHFTKPNDLRAISLMNSAATEILRQFSDICLAYGQSDEYSFIFHESTTLFDRRASKLATTIAATFSVEYALQWGQFMKGEEGEGEGMGMELTRPFPSFDGRCVAYPKRRVLRDYLGWRQADCHVNNLYNTTFWALVQQGNMSGTEAELFLKGTVSSDKNEILFSRFGINYNNEPEVFKKGSVVYRSFDETSAPTQRMDGGDGALPGGNTDASSRGGPGIDGNGRSKVLSKTQAEKERKRKMKAKVVVEHVDIIKDAFWLERPYILGGAAE